MIDNYAIPENKAKSQNSVIVRSFYAILNNGEGLDQLKLYVEEIIIQTPRKKTREVISYKIITKRQLSDRVQDKSLAPSASTADSYSVADLFRLVKSADKNFSGKTANKVVNDDGTLKVVYHGTDGDFPVFDTTSGMNIQGAFFSPWELDAQGYGKNVGAYYLNIRNPAPEATRIIGVKLK